MMSVQLVLVGLLGLLIAGCQRPTPPGDLPEGVRRNAVVIVVDTFRADALVQSSTPALDEFAREGVEVPRAWSAATWTAPSVISMFTGAHVREHGWDFPFPGNMEHRNRSYPGVPERPVLASVLHDAGFQTTGYYCNPLLRHDLGYDRGFDRWKWARDPQVARLVAREVAAWDPQDRHFLYIHLFGMHQPLTPSPEARKRWEVDSSHIKRGRGFHTEQARKQGAEGMARYARAYYAEAEDLDRRMGDLIRALAPVQEDTLVIITADHGEMLGEHGRIGHNKWVYEQLTHVPFMAHGVDPLPQTFSLAGLADLVTRSLGVSHEWPVSGQDATLLVAQREGKLAISQDGLVRAMWDPEGVPGGFGIYDVRDDPKEQTPLAFARTEFDRMRADWEARTPQTVLQTVDGPMDGSLLEALGELGYMDE